MRRGIQVIPSLMMPPMIRQGGWTATWVDRPAGSGVWPTDAPNKQVSIFNLMALGTT